MIPLKDYNPARHFPYVGLMLIILNVLVFAVDRMTGELVQMTFETSRGVVTTNSFIGGLTQRYALVPVNATRDFSSLPTIFSSMFLHGNLLHIGSNMLFLWIFGNNVEDVFGRFKFLAFYFACGFFAALAQILSDPQSVIPMVGASGAIAGVMGAYLVLFPRARVLTLVPIFFFFTFLELPALVIIGYWALLQFLNANWFGGGEIRGGGIAYFAHLGGFITGLVWALLLKARRFL